MIEMITTTKNKTYKYIKSLQQKKYRAELKRFTVEGIKSVSDAVTAQTEIEMIAVSETFWNTEKFSYPKEAHIVSVKDELFCGLCDTKTPQGIIAVIKIVPNTQYSFNPEKLYIYCDNVSDPGNLGTIIRTADAAGFGGVLLSGGCADIYSPKTVRASMGSFFNIDVIPYFSYDMLIKQKEKGFSLYSGALSDDSIEYTEYDYTKPTVFIIGNEANGVSDNILKISKHIIIPIYGKAESLNAGVAGAVLMYEAVRQRGGVLNGG